MKTETYKLKFLTPCFCGGADPSRAELRPSAIRGQLRWWFRAIGGTREEETEIFGGAEKEKGRASAIIIRTNLTGNRGDPNWHTRIPKQGTNYKVYLLGFYCGRTNRIAPNGAIPPNSEFDVILTYRREIPEKLKQKFALALRAFLSIGAIGYRATRTAGALTFREPSNQLTSEKWESLKSALERCGFKLFFYPESFKNPESLKKPKNFNNWEELCNEAGFLLKQKLRGKNELNISAGEEGKTPNILGCSEPRQASVLHLRPTIIDGKLRLLLIEAPHERIIGDEVLKKARFKNSIIGKLTGK